MSNTHERGRMVKEKMDQAPVGWATIRGFYSQLTAHVDRYRPQYGEPVYRGEDGTSVLEVMVPKSLAVEARVVSRIRGKDAAPEWKLVYEMKGPDGKFSRNTDLVRVDDSGRRRPATEGDVEAVRALMTEEVKGTGLRLRVEEYGDADSAQRTSERRWERERLEREVARIHSNGGPQTLDEQASVKSLHQMLSEDYQRAEDRRRYKEM